MPTTSSPLLLADAGSPGGTGLILFPRPGLLPAVWVGPVPATGLDPADVAALLAAARPGALLPEHGLGWFGRPGLSGHRLGDGAGPAAGRDWSPVFQPTSVGCDGCRARVEAADATAGLRLVTDAEAVPGGAVRVRHTLANTGPQPYVVAGLEVVFPLPTRIGEVLDFTGRRIDLAILERVQRVWTSDMTDALARQPIQRWTGQLVPPEYLGAHVSALFSHQTGRYLPLSLRCATALFGHLGIEWDLSQASRDELARLADWIELYKRHRALIHSGRMVRLDTAEDTAWMYGVVAADRSAALMCYVQLDEPRSDQPPAMRVPGLDPGRRYRVGDVTPADEPPRPAGLADVVVSGAALGEIGLAIPAQRALTAAVILIQAC